MNNAIRFFCTGNPERLLNIGNGPAEGNTKLFIDLKLVDSSSIKTNTRTTPARLVLRVNSNVPVLSPLLVCFQVFL